MGRVKKVSVFFLFRLFCFFFFDFFRSSVLIKRDFLFFEFFILLSFTLWAIRRLPSLYSVLVLESLLAAFVETTILIC